MKVSDGFGVRLLLKIALLGQLFEVGVERGDLFFERDLLRGERGAFRLGLLLLEHDGAELVTHALERSHGGISLLGGRGEGGGEEEDENGTNEEALHGRVLSAYRARTQENSSAHC